MAEINDLNVTSASNTARWPESMRVNQVNNAARDTESIIARWHRDTNGSVAVSGTNTYSATINADTGFTLYDGFVFWGDFANANTGAATINLTPDGGSALGAKAITKAGSSALIASDITTGMKVALVYDGTNFQMMSPPGTACAGGTLTSVAAGAGFSFATITSAGTIAVDGVLQDLDTTGVVGGDGEFLVGTGAGAMAWESASTALASIGGIGAATTNTLTAKTVDANGTGNVYTNFDIGNMIAASQAEAEAGTDTTKILSALRVKQAIAALGNPSGTILDYAGASTPTGYVLCDGAAYNSATDTSFAALYTAIANTYGGSDSTDFRVPDMRGRVSIGQDDMGGTSANRIVETEAHGVNGDTLGAVGGVGQHAITTAEMAAHTHQITASWNVTGGSVYAPSGANQDNNTTRTTTSTGGGGAHTNLQPSIVVNKIIKK